LRNPLHDNELGNPAQVSAAAGAAIEGNSAPIDPDLMTVVAAWPKLPKAVRQQVVALVADDYISP
jgi:hypothetical protein